MKPRESKVHSLYETLARLLRVASFLFLLGARFKAAAADDLKTFDSEESYVVESVPIVLTLNVGEATVKVDSSLKDASQLTAANGTTLNRERALPARIGVYRIETAEPPGEAVSKTALDSLNQDAKIEFAYPVYINAATGKRHFLNDELVVRLNAPFDPGMGDLL